MTGTIPKNAGSTSEFASKKARALCWNPRRRFHFSGPSGFPFGGKSLFPHLANPPKLSRIARKLEENSRLRGDRLPVPQKSGWTSRRATKPKAGPGRGLWRGAATTQTGQAGSRKFVQDRTETRRKLRVQGGQVARFSFFPLRPGSPLRNSRSWRVLATANRRDWSVRNSKCFCRVSHLSRNDRIAKGIVARNDF